MNWTRLVLRIETDEAPWVVADELQAHGAMGVSMLPLGASEALLEPVPGETPVAGMLRLEALFDSQAGAQRAAAATGLEDRCRHESLADRDWVAQGRHAFRPQRFGRQLWIVPEWETPPEPEAINVMLAPGLAFGTGMHPSTALCLEWLARAELRGKTLVDYGCGSGVLAVAAARLGAREVVAVDNDPQALEATRANARRNAVAVGTCEPEVLEARAVDVVVANILARPLVALAGELSARVRAGGRIILAGIDTSQADSVVAAYLPAARLLDRHVREDWVCLELQRDADQPA